MMSPDRIPNFQLDLGQTRTKAACYKEVFIGNDDNYSSVIREICTYLTNQRLLPFFGAGVSWDEPSRLSLADPLKAALRDALWESAQVIQAPREEREIAEKHLKNAPLERLLDVLHRTHGKAALEYLSILNGRLWNKNHAIIAELAKAGLLPRLVTLNFDLLFEGALRDQQRSSETYCPLTNSRFSVGTNERVLSILKPHGSFAPENDPYAFLSATLSQAGTEPSPANEKALGEMLAQSSALLVGGYSDNDWDIFPIFARLVPGRLERIFWVQWADEHFVKKRQLPKQDKEPSLHERIIPWLKDESKTDSILLIGNITVLLEDVLDELRNEFGRSVEYIAPSERKTPPDLPNNLPFKPGASPQSEQTLKGLAALALLISNSGKYSWRVLEYLRDHIDHYSLALAWKVEETLSNAEHTRGALRQSIRHMRRSIAIRTLTTDSKPDGHSYVWLGYKYFCRTKRPEQGEIFASWVVRFPLNLIMGFFYTLRGSWMKPTLKASHGLRVASASVMARYYRIDLVHTWAYVSLRKGKKLRPLYQLLFGLVETWYARLKEVSNLMDREYYYLRHLETLLFSGREIENLPSVKTRLDELERSYRLTQNNVQLGNAYAYRALILAMKENGMEEARRQLDEAVRVWTTGDQDMASGQRRVILFRDFLGIQKISGRKNNER